MLLDRVLPQLILFPLALHLLGKESFGRFGFALGIVSIVGLAPATGLNNTILRGFANVSAERRPLMLRTAFAALVVVVGLLALLAIAASLGATTATLTETTVSGWIALIVRAVAARNLV